VASQHITCITCTLPFRFLPCFPTLTPILTICPTATTLRRRRTTRRTNNGAGAYTATHTANTTTLPLNISPRLAPILPNPPAAQRRTTDGPTDGQSAAWSGHRLVAVAHSGPTASNPSPRPLISTTTPARPVASTDRPPRQPNVLQGEGATAQAVSDIPSVPSDTPTQVPNPVSDEEARQILDTWILNSDWLRQDMMEPMVGDHGVPTCAPQLASSGSSIYCCFLIPVMYKKGKISGWKSATDPTSKPDRHQRAIGKERAKRGHCPFKCPRDHDPDWFVRSTVIIDLVLILNL